MPIIVSGLAVRDETLDQLRIGPNLCFGLERCLNTDRFRKARHNEEGETSEMAPRKRNHTKCYRGWLRALMPKNPFALFRSGARVKEVGASVGYNMPSTFSHDFKQRFGRSPTDTARVMSVQIHVEGSPMDAIMPPTAPQVHQRAVLGAPRILTPRVAAERNSG